MIEPKPLTKERLANITAVMKDWPMIGEVIAAEAYWREQVKNAQFRASDSCPWCESYEWEFDKHEPDCAWKLANES